MKAARVHRFGEALRIDEVDEPSPSGGEVLASVEFAAVNPQDIWLTRGTVAGAVEPPERTKRDLEEVLEELAGGRLRVPIAAILPLQEAPEAHRRILKREVSGKLILQP